MSRFRNKRANEVTSHHHLRALVMNMNPCKRLFMTSTLCMRPICPHLHHNHHMPPWSHRSFSCTFFIGHWVQPNILVLRISFPPRRHSGVGLLPHPRCNSDSSPFCFVIYRHPPPYYRIVRSNYNPFTTCCTLFHWT